MRLFQINECNHNYDLGKSVYAWFTGRIMQFTVSTHLLSDRAAEMRMWCPLHWKNYQSVTMANEILELTVISAWWNLKAKYVFFWCISFRFVFAFTWAFISLSAGVDLVHVSWKLSVHPALTPGDNQALSQHDSSPPYLLLKISTVWIFDFL